MRVLLFYREVLPYLNTFWLIADMARRADFIPTRSSNIQERQDCIEGLQRVSWSCCGGWKMEILN
jgi:hypothetical protein